MLKILIDYPSHDEELTIVQRQLVEPVQLRQAVSLDELRELQQAVFQVYVDPALISYAVALAVATREPGAHGFPELAAYVAFGASPRGPISLVMAARALAPSTRSASRHVASSPARTAARSWAVDRPGGVLADETHCCD